MESDKLTVLHQIMEMYMAELIYESTKTSLSRLFQEHSGTNVICTMANSPSGSSESSLSTAFFEFD